MKVHAVPVARSPGRGSHGTEALREELEAENEGIRIPSAIRWLSGAASVKARYEERTITASSVVLAVAGEATYRLVRKGGLRLKGRRCDAEAYEEIWPDVRCDHCSSWGHISSKCTRTTARCGWSAEERATTGHQCPVEGCRVKEGHWCRHTVAKCANCKGPHFAQANACPKKKAARAEAKGCPSGGSEAISRGQKSHLPPPRAPEGEVEEEELRHESNSGEEIVTPQ